MHARPHPRVTLAFILAYLALVLVASLWPFTGWRPLTGWSLDFLFAPLPRYITRNDITTNLLVYVPLGYVLALHWSRPRRRGPAIVAAALTGLYFSGLMESLQQLLPGRIASNLDLYVNGLGTLLGALLSLHHNRWLRAWRAFRRWRERWFRASLAARLGVALLLLWVLSQLSLLPFPGAGWLDLHLRPIDTPPRIAQINPAWLLAVFMEMAALGAFTACLVRPGRYASAVLLVFISAFAVKLLAATALLKLKVVGGILSLETLTAFLLAFWLLLLPWVSRHRRQVAMLLLAVILLGRLVFMESPLWPGGSLLNVVGFAAHVSALWPWLALALLAWPRQQGRNLAPYH